MKALLVCLALATGAAVALPATLARAQEVAPEAPLRGPAGAPARFQAAPRDPLAAAVPPAPETPNHPRGRALFFWLFAAIAVGGAIMTITRKNAVMAVMSLVASFLGLSGLYVLLFAHFLAVIQVLVYAGAIMVLFVFVIMILNKEEEEPWALRGVLGKGIAGIALVYFLVRLIQVLWGAPGAIAATMKPGAPPPDFGTTRAMADLLFGRYLFPFEAVSLVLLIAVVGALVLAHPAHPNVGEEELS
jgi:NADH-quinone oxidoreductase subunit J